jgi:hypothetical protein
MSQSSLQTDHEGYRTPRWVKLFGIATLIVVLLVVAVLATGLGGEHGPGRHLPSVTQKHTAPMDHTE